MVELLVVLAIMGMGIAWLLETIGSGIYFAKDTENNIKAINLAREWIEWVLNFRDTNWLRFSWDRTNCWRTQSYDGGCINTPGYAGLVASGAYTLLSKNWAWLLSWITIVPTAPINFATNWTGYKGSYRVGLDDRGFYTQTGVVTSASCTWLTQTWCLTLFTREININVVSSGSMTVQSIVRWREKRDRSVILETTLTNWKSNF